MGQPPYGPMAWRPHQVLEPGVADLPAGECRLSGDGIPRSGVTALVLEEHGPGGEAALNSFPVYCNGIRKPGALSGPLALPCAAALAFIAFAQAPE